MREKRECKVVQDLLPNYIEKLTNEETNLFIEEHIKTCEECKATLESMEKDLKVDTEKVNTKGINIIKKYNVRLKVFKALAIMFLLVVLIGILSIERRMIILTSLMNKVKEIDYSNSYVCMKFFDSANGLTTINSYLKDNIELRTVESIRTEDKYYRKEIDYYKNEEEQFSIRKEYDKNTNTFKEYANSKSSGHGQNSLNLMGIGIYMQTLEEYFDFSFNSTIDSIKYEGKDCYLVKKGTYELIIEKSTGLWIRTTIEGYVIYNDYSFGTVTDKDIEKPDISGYKKYGE